MTRGVKNLLSGARQAPVAAALEALVEGKPVRGRGRGGQPCAQRCRGPVGGGRRFQ
jgi:hypothetical protein